MLKNTSFYQIVMTLNAINNVKSSLSYLSHIMEHLMAYIQIDNSNWKNLIIFNQTKILKYLALYFRYNVKCIIPLRDFRQRRTRHRRSHAIIEAWIYHTCLSPNTPLSQALTMITLCLTPTLEYGTIKYIFVLRMFIVLNIMFYCRGSLISGFGR